MIKILIADDHALIREGLKKIIKTAPEMAVAAEAENADQVIESLEKNELDIVLLDISLPGKNGLELLKEIKFNRPKLPVLVLTMHPESRYGIQALKAGASGYLTKDSPPDELIVAIRKVAQGRKHVSPLLAEKLVFHLKGDFEKTHEMLSDREFQVFRLIGTGKSARDIAEELNLSMSTVNTYRTRILQKMNLKTDAEIIRYAIQHKLVD